MPAQKLIDKKNNSKTACSIPKCLFGVIFLDMEQTTEVAFSDSRAHVGKSFRPHMWIIMKAPKTLSSITWRVTFHQFYGIANWTDYRGKRGLDGLEVGIRPTATSNATVNKQLQHKPFKHNQNHYQHNNKFYLKHTSQKHRHGSSTAANSTSTGTSSTGTSSTGTSSTSLTSASFCNRHLQKQHFNFQYFSKQHKHVKHINKQFQHKQFKHNHFKHRWNHYQYNGNLYLKLHKHISQQHQHRYLQHFLDRHQRFQHFRNQHLKKRQKYINQHQTIPAQANQTSPEQLPAQRHVVVLQVHQPTAATQVLPARLWPAPAPTTSTSGSSSSMSSISTSSTSMSYTSTSSSSINSSSTTTKTLVMTCLNDCHSIHELRCTWNQLKIAEVSPPATRVELQPFSGAVAFLIIFFPTMCVTNISPLLLYFQTIDMKRLFLPSVRVMFHSEFRCDTTLAKLPISSFTATHCINGS